MTDTKKAHKKPPKVSAEDVKPSGQTSLKEKISIIASLLQSIILLLNLMAIITIPTITIVIVSLISLLFFVFVYWLGSSIRKYLKITIQNWKWFLISMVSLITLTVMYSLWIGNWIEFHYSNQCARTGLQITSHVPGSEVDHEKVEVWGTFEKEPKEVGILLMIESPNGLGFWPSDPVEIDQTKNEWRGVVYLSGTPPIQAEIVIATMGKSGSVLYDYYQQVARMTDQYIAIRLLTADIDKCQNVSITRTK